MSQALEDCLLRVPGLVLGTSHHGERSIHALGSRRLFGVDHPDPMEEETAFDLGSITKIVATTSSFMALKSQNMFSLEDKVARFLPEWSNGKKSAITIQDLFLHRAGLWEWRPLYIEDQDPHKVAGRIATIPLRYERNEGRHYSDLGFITLGNILTVISHEELSETINRLVLDPLEMNMTRFAHPVSPTNVAATSWGDSIEREMVRSKSPFPVPEVDSAFTGWRGEIVVGDANDGNAFHLFNGISSHAGLFSTASDLLQFGESILASLAGAGYFAPEIVKLFLTEGPDMHQSLGFRSWSDNCEGCSDVFFGHTGFPGTVIAFSPKHNFVATLLTNRLHVKGSPTNTEELWRPVLAELHQKLHSL